MYRRAFALALFLGYQVLSTHGTALHAQEDSKPWWNPFATTSATDTAEVRESSFFKSGGGETGPLFKLPNWSWMKPKTSSSKGPSMLQKMGKTTKQFWGNTVDFINPFDSNSKPQKSQGYQLLNSGYQPQKQKMEKAGSGPLGWLWREQTIESPTNVNDFLRLPRPKF